MVIAGEWLVRRCWLILLHLFDPAIAELNPYQLIYRNYLRPGIPEAQFFKIFSE